MILDDLDRALLKALQSDASQSTTRLGRKLGLSQPATWRRVRRLQDAGIIAQKRVRLDAAKLGFDVTVFLGIKLATKGRVSLEDFERAIGGIPEVHYRIRVIARDLADFERVLRRRIMTLPGVGDVEANVLLSEERRSGPL